MKQILSALFILTVFSGRAQLSTELKAFNGEIDHPFHLPLQQNKQAIRLKKEFLRNIYNDTSFSLGCSHFCYPTFNQYRKAQSKNLYVDDFDADGDDDLLFFGQLCPAYENNNVILYLKNDSTYIEKQLGTDFDQMHQTNSGYFIQCTFWLPSDPYALVMQYQTNKRSPDQIEQLTCQLFTYELPNMGNCQKLDTILHFDTEKQLFLRANPDRTWVEKYNSHDEDLLGLIPENFDVHAYNTVVLDGKTWYYVIVEPGNGFTLRKDVNLDFYGEIKVVRGWICVE